jgi:tetratricopeptide (TPR) repeat protein
MAKRVLVRSTNVNRSLHRMVVPTARGWVRVVPFLLLAAWGSAAADTFVVLPFRNAPGYRELDYLIAGAPALFAEKLAGSTAPAPAYGPRLFPDGAHPPEDDAAAARQAAAAGARYAVVGTVARRRNWDLDLEVRVLAVGARRDDGGVAVEVRWRGREVFPKARQLAALDQLLTGAAKALGVLPEGSVALARFHHQPARDPYSFFLYGRAVGVFHRVYPAQKRDLGAVEAGLRRALVVSPAFVEARRFLALVLEEAGDRRAARAQYAAVVERRPASFWAQAALARLLRDEGAKTRAVEAATRALALRPGATTVRFLRAELLWELGRADEAYVELRRVTGEAPRLVAARRLLAQVCSARGAFEEQARELERVRALQPGDLQAGLDLGAAWLRLRRWDRAVAVYDDLRRAHPDHFMVHKLLGDLYRRKRDYRRAAVAYEQAMRIDPKDPRPYFLLSQTLAEGGSYERAEQVLAAAQQFKEYLGEAYNNLGAIAIRRADYPRAGAFLRRALIRIPDRPRVRYNYGLALAGTRQFDKALEQFRLAVKLDPLDPEYHYAEGVTYLRLRRVKEAEAAFRHAVVVGEGHAGALRNLALIAEMRRRRAENEVVSPDLAAPWDGAPGEARGAWPPAGRSRRGVADGGVPEPRAARTARPAPRAASRPAAVQPASAAARRAPATRRAAPAPGVKASVSGRRPLTLQRPRAGPER